MLNTNLLPDESKADVRFRIVGRQAPNKDAATDTMEKKPNLSWSVPFSWPFVMMGRVKKGLMTPEPLDTKDAPVLENFKQG